MALRLLIATMLIVLLAACGGGDDEAQTPVNGLAGTQPPTQPATPEPDESPTAPNAAVSPSATPSALESTETPGKTPTILITSTPEVTATTAATATVEPEPAATDADLAGVVLQLTDVPAGWVASADEEDDDDPNICDVEDVSNLYPDQPYARSSFEGGQTGPFVGSFITTLGEDDANELLTYVRETFGNCGTWTATSNGQTSTFTASEMSFPEAGDDRYAVQVEGTVGTFPFVAEIIYIRVGENLIGLSHFGLNDVVTNLTVGWVETMVARAEGLGNN